MSKIRIKRSQKIKLQKYKITWIKVLWIIFDIKMPSVVILLKFAFEENASTIPILVKTLFSSYSFSKRNFGISTWKKNFLATKLLIASRYREKEDSCNPQKKCESSYTFNA